MVWFVVNVDFEVSDTIFFSVLHVKHSLRVFIVFR